MAAPQLASMTRIAVDFPGHGESSFMGRGSCSMEAFAEVLRSVLVAHTPRAKLLHIVAHSMGGAPGLILASDPPMPVVSFLNAEGNLISSDCGLFSRRSAEMPATEFREKFAKFLERSAADESPVIRAWAGWLSACHPDAFHAAARSLVAWSDSGRLLQKFQQLAAKKLYVYGEHSLNPEILEVIGGTPVQRVTDSGHFLMIEKPDIFAKSVVELAVSSLGELV